MTTLHTASWAVMAERHAHGERSVLPVRVSLGLPRFWPLAASFPYVPELAPAGGLFDLPPEKFAPAYARRLERFGIDHIAERLEAIYAEYGRPLALCCFEPRSADCHRGLAAAWLDLRFGPVHELASPTHGTAVHRPGAGKTEPAQYSTNALVGKFEPAQLTPTEEER